MKYFDRAYLSRTRASRGRGLIDVVNRRGGEMLDAQRLRNAVGTAEPLATNVVLWDVVSALVLTRRKRLQKPLFSESGPAGFTAIAAALPGIGGSTAYELIADIQLRSDLAINSCLRSAIERAGHAAPRSGMANCAAR